MRRNRKITFLETYFISQIRIFIASGIPICFIGINKVVTGIFSLIETDAVKNKEFCFRAKEYAVGYACVFKIFFSFLRDIAGITGIRFSGQRIVNIADNA